MNEIKRILVVVGEDSHHHGAALANAQALAERHDAALTVVDVHAYLDDYSAALADIMPEEELRPLVLGHRREQLQRLVRQNKSTVCQTAEVKVLNGVPFIEIIREVLWHKQDLIIKVAEGERGPGERLFASIDMHLMRKSPVPVWVLNPDAKASPKRVLVAIDAVTENDESRDFNCRILDLARTVACTAGAELHVLSAWHLVGESSMLHSPFLKMDERRVQQLLNNIEDRVSRQQQELVGWFTRTHADTPSPQLHRTKGLAREVIPTFVREHDVDLVVMGTIGRTGIPGLLIGNTAESVLSEVNCSVLTLKPHGFTTPVAGG